MSASVFRMTLIAVALAGMATAAVGLPGCGAHLQTITIGMESTAVNSLIYLALDQGYFSKNHLNVIIKDYPSGKAAVDGLLGGQVNVVTASEFVMVGHAFADSPISTLASIDEFLHIYLVARKDRGIKEASDLKGKTVGVPLKTAAEFSLGRFLELHGIPAAGVDFVDTAPADSVESLASGEVDAVITWRPFVNEIEDQLGDRVMKWQAQSQQAAYCLAIAQRAWVNENPELVQRLLRSLLSAEEYNANHGEEARASIQAQLGYDEPFMATVWPEHFLVVELGQSLVAAMQDEARWMIGNRLVKAEEVPDFSSFIHEEGLEALRPAAVDVMR